MAALPITRSLEYREKSGTPIDQGEYLNRMLSWREAARAEAYSELKQRPEYDRIPEYINYIEGKHWPRDRPRYRSDYSDSMVGGARIESLALLTDIKPVIEVTSHVKALKEHGRINNEVIKDQWIRHDWDLKLIDVVDHASFGEGYWYCGCIPGYGNNLPRITLTAHGIDEVLPIHCNQDIQEASAVLFTQPKSVQYFRNKWGHRARGLEFERATQNVGSMSGRAVLYGIDRYTWNALSPAFRKLMSDRVAKTTEMRAESFPTAQLEEYWIEDYEVADRDLLIKDPYLSLEGHNYWYRVKKGERKWPRKRLVVFGNDRLFYDGPSPYWHGQYPFPRLRLIPITWAPGGLSKYRSLLPLNRAVNEIGAGIMDLIKKAVNPQAVTRKGAMTDAAWRSFLPDRAGGKLLMNPNATPADLRYMDPPNLPTYVFETLVRYLLPRYKELAGQLDLRTLTGKKQVPGGDAIEQMRDAQAPHFRLESRLLERFIKDTGYQGVSHVIQHFKWDDRLRILGERGLEFSDFDLKPESMVLASMWAQKEAFWKLFSVSVAQGSLHAQAHDREKQIAMTLFKMAAIDREALLEMLEYPNREAVLKRMAEMQAAAAQAAKTGGGRTPRTSGQKKGAVV